MSVKLMSAIFETEFRDLIDDDGNVTKASTAKLVLLALADHANDEGESAYPSVDRLAKKTALSPQTIRNTFDALKYNGLVFRVGTSKHMTNNYTINTNCYPVLNGEKGEFLPLQPVDPSNELLNPSNRSPEPLNRLDPNHPLTIIEPSTEPPSKPEKQGDPIDGMLFYGNQAKARGEDKVEELIQEIERGLHVNIARTTGNQAVARRILKDGRPFGQWLTWCISDEWRAARLYLYADLEKIWQVWPQAFERRTDEQRPQYAPIPERRGVPRPAHIPPPNIKRGEA